MAEMAKIAYMSYMTNEDWKYKIINASPKRLVIVTYEIILDRIHTALIALDSGDAAEFRARIGNAREFVSELVCALDMSNDVSVKLRDLYWLVNKLLAKACFPGCGTNFEAGDTAKKHLGQAEKIVGSLMRAFENEVDDQSCVYAKGCENYSGVSRAYRALGR